MELLKWLLHVEIFSKVSQQPAQHQLLVLGTSARSAETSGTWKVSGSHWGAFRARIYAGKVQEIKPLESDTNPTDMINGIKGIIYNPSRIRYPMVRLDWLKKHKYGAETRGDNRFVRVTWDEALDLFYRELERVQKDMAHGRYIQTNRLASDRSVSQLYQSYAASGWYAWQFYHQGW